MTRLLVVLGVIGVLGVSCAASGGVTGADGPRLRTAGATDGTSVTPSQSPLPSPSPDEPAEPLPAPDEPVPTRRDELAQVFEQTFTRNRDAIAVWYRRGDPATWPPPRDVVLLTLYEQRIYRWLAERPAVANGVIDRLARRIAVEAGRNVAATHALFEHFGAVNTVPDFRIRRPEPADVLRSYFRAAERRFGIDWEVLAAVMLIETRMGRIRSASAAGAQGPMQFIPSTWEAYGMGGEINDPEDAIMGAANYLRASGAPEDYRRALYAYNPVDAYVNAVWWYARTMMRFPDAYYAYYNWQVYVRTVDGDVRLSGPGL
jgi:Transglycosylase SLT domain